MGDSSWKAAAGGEWRGNAGVTGEKETNGDKDY